MIYISLFTCMVLGFGLILPIGNRKVKWKYRNICKLLQWMKQRGKTLPKWVNETFVFQCWKLLFFGNLVLSVWLLFFGSNTITRLEKPLSGEGSAKEEMQIIWQDEGGKTHTEKVQIEINEQQLGEEESTRRLEEVKTILKDEILGENKSLEEVNKPLHLMESLDKYNAQISWTSDSPSVLRWDGMLGEEIPKEGAYVTLSATIEIQGQQEMCEIQVKVFPPEYNWLEDLKSVIQKTESEDSWLELPKEWNGISIVWKRDKSAILIFLTAVVFVSPVLLFFKKKQDIEEEEKKRRQQMLQDYPEIISKLMLLLSAGMSLRKTMEKIVADYKKYYQRREKRAAYELLADICSEINCGVTEKQAYESIGERCELLQYKTLSALLVQHLQKGNMGMEQILAEEVRKSQELRQQQAKVLGEQASAKLLFPMLLMMLVVFIILIVPAWISFSI